MENASKALIIAGAILISIVLVSVGVIVVQSLDPSSATEKMDEQAVQAFNSKFDSYIGVNVSGTSVRSLLRAVATNNTTNAEEESKIIKVTTNGLTDNITEESATEKINNLIPKIGTAYRYEVTTSTNNVSGIIEKINIKKK